MALSTDLVSYYKLDEASGDVTDSVGGITGTNTSVTFAAANGKINNGAIFNGSADITSAATVNVATNATLSCWFKTTSTTMFAGLFGYSTANQGFILSMDQSGYARAWLQDNNGNYHSQLTTATVNDGKWHHLVATKTNTSGTNYKLELFLDTVSQGSTTDSYDGNFNTTYMYMGYNGGSSYTGDLDECGYWSRAVTTAEILKLYNGFSAIQYPFTAKFWVGDTGSWSETAHWSLASGGAGGEAVPSSSEIVFFDENSFSTTGKTVTIDGTTNNTKSTNFAAVTNSPTVAGTGQLRMYDGSFAVANSVTWSATGSVSMNSLLANGTELHFKTGGITMPAGISFGNGGANGGGTISLESAIVSTLSINVSSGVTFNTNNYNVTGFAFECSSPANATVINMGSSTFTLNFAGGSGSSNYNWNCSGANLTINSSFSTIKFVNSGLGTMKFSGGDKGYNNLWFTGIDNSNFRMYGDNVFNDIKCDSHPVTIGFYTGSTQSTSSFTVNGVSGELITLQRYDLGDPWNLFGAAADITCNWVSLSDSAASGGGVTFTAANSIDGGGNTGWNITPAPISFLSVETVSITEDFSPILIFCPSVNDDVSIDENIEFFIPILKPFVEEDISIAETPSVIESTTFITYEPIIVTEDVGGNVPFLAVISSDDITLSEDFPINIKTLLSVNDTITINEDFSGVTVFSFVVYEDISVVEALVYDPDILYVTEYISIYVITRDVIANDPITVSDNPSLTIPELFISVEDVITVLEDIQAYKTIVYIDVNEQITVVDELSSILENPLLMSVSDDIIVSEDPVVFITVLYLETYDLVVISPDFILLDIYYSLFVFDTTTVSDVISMGEVFTQGRLFPNVPRGNTFSMQGSGSIGFNYSFGTQYQDNTNYGGRIPNIH